MSDVLYAKSQVGGKVVTLAEHSKAVLDAARCIYGKENPTAMGLSWLRFFGLTEEDFHTFIINLSLAAIFHDVGKANSGFQLAISRKGEQVIRHEHLSALILWLPEIWKWLETSSYIKREIVLAAVLCHHLKVNDSDQFLHNLTPTDGFSVYCRHTDFAKVLQLAESIIGQPAPDISSYEGRWTFNTINRKSLRAHLYRHVTKAHRKDIPTRNLYLAVKSGPNRCRCMWFGTGA